MLDPTKVQFVNSYPPPTAIWRYSRLAAMAIGEGGRLATICLGNLDFDTLDPALTTILGKWPLPKQLSTILNYTFPAFVSRSESNEWKRLLASGGVLHFLAEDIPPWITSGKIAVTIHGNPMATLESDLFYSFSVGYKTAVKFNLHRYARDAVAIAQSEYVRNGLEEFGYDGPIRVIPPAVDPIFGESRDRLAARQSLNLPLHRPILLSISTAERRKNLAVLPKVMDLLPSDYLLVRVGPPVRGCHSLRDLSDQQVAQLYSASDALLFPTLEEGFGLPVIEAFASGLPVVTSAIPVVDEVSGGSALLVDPADPMALAAAIRTAVTSREYFSRLGLTRAKEFTLDKLGRRLSDFYRRL